MRLKRELKITGFSLERGLEAGGLELKFDDDILKKYSIKPSTNLIGRNLVVTLISSDMKKRLNELERGQMIIDRIKKEDIEERTYQIPDITGTICYSVHFSSPYPSYPHLNFRINDEEYKKLKKVPLKTLFRVSFKVK